MQKFKLKKLKNQLRFFIWKFDLCRNFGVEIFYEILAQKINRDFMKISNFRNRLRFLFIHLLIFLKIQS